MSDVRLVLVDVEARGPSPFSGEMSEFGAVAMNRSETGPGEEFHGVLIEARPDPNNPAVPKIYEGAKRYSVHQVMKDFKRWLDSLGDRVVFVSDNPTWDGMWIWDAFDRAGIENPFGHSGRRISDFYAGLQGDWRQSQKWKRLRITKHTHHPVEDARGNAEALGILLHQSRKQLDNPTELT